MAGGVFSSAAQKDCFNDLDVEEYSIVGTLDKDTCALCGSLDGKVFKMSEYAVGVTAPPFHPWCRCCTAPYFADMEGVGERYARDGEGKGYTVPRDMTYEEWSKKAFNNSGSFNENVETTFTGGGKRDIIEKKEALSYEDWEKADTILTEEAESWVTNLTGDERDCTVAYTNTAYEDINSWLRSGMEYDDRLEDLVANIDSAIEKFDLKQDLSVVRGTSTGVLQSLGYKLDTIIGEPFSDPAYLSSTLSKEIASDFAEWAVNLSGGEKIFIQLDIPAGKNRGAFVDTISANSGEKEFLIRRSALFEFYESVQNKDGILLKARWKT